MRPGVTGEQLKRVRKTLLDARRQPVVHRIPVRKLGVHAVERHRNSKSCRVTFLWRTRPEEARRKTGSSRDPNEKRILRCAGARKGWIRSGRTEELNRRGRRDRCSIQSRERSWATAQRSDEARNGWRKRAAVCGGHLSWMHTDAHRRRTARRQDTSHAIRIILREQLRMGRVDIHRPVEMLPLRVLVAHAH